jgi:hypothetical protein
MRPQKYGPGNVIARVSMRISIADSTLFNYALGANMQASEEFASQALIYKYYKIECVKVTQQQMNIINVITPGYFKVDFSGIPLESIPNLYQSDDIKVFNAFNTKPRSWSFLPPHVDNGYVQDAYRPVTTADNTKFFAYQQFGTGINLLIEVVVRFRGLIDRGVSTKIMYYESLLQKLKQEEKNKENEKEEEDKKEIEKEEDIKEEGKEEDEIKQLIQRIKAM